MCMLSIYLKDELVLIKEKVIGDSHKIAVLKQTGAQPLISIGIMVPKEGLFPLEDLTHPEELSVNLTIRPS